MRKLVLSKSQLLAYQSGCYDTCTLSQLTWSFGEIGSRRPTIARRMKRMEGESDWQYLAVVIETMYTS
jgi:hypothetical protein